MKLLLLTIVKCLLSFVMGSTYYISTIILSMNELLQIDAVKNKNVDVHVNLCKQEWSMTQKYAGQYMVTDVLFGSIIQILTCCMDMNDQTRVVPLVIDRWEGGTSLHYIFRGSCYLPCGNILYLSVFTNDSYYIDIESDHTLYKYKGTINDNVIECLDKGMVYKFNQSYVVHHGTTERVIQHKKEDRVRKHITYNDAIYPLHRTTSSSLELFSIQDEKGSFLLVDGNTYIIVRDGQRKDGTMPDSDVYRIENRINIMGKEIIPEETRITSTISIDMNNNDHGVNSTKVANV